LGAIDLASNAVNHGRTKHIDIEHHWIREQIKQNRITLNYCKASDMTADLLTKPLHPGPFWEHMKGIGLKRCA
jgi:hypothetical protein